MLARGTTRGPYKLRALRSVGGMREVYRDEDPKHRGQSGIEVLSRKVPVVVGSERLYERLRVRVS